jgi:tetratricopeptide (TPR) repeat protein
MNLRGIGMVTALTLASVVLPVQGQGFGAAKQKVTLQRKLPALMRLPGDTITVKVTGHQDQTDLIHDLQALLETELLKDDPQLRAEDQHPATTVTAQIISFDHPRPVETRQQFGNTVTVTRRVTGALNVAFQARTSGGRALASENISAKYDQQFDASGNNLSHGIMNDLKNPFHGLKGNKGNDDQGDKQPTESELQTILLTDAVHQIAEQIVNTNEAIEVFLAKDKGAIDEGDKQAVAGLWEKALETFETAPALTKKDDDAYRLYNIGVANEALGYAAEDSKSAMKFLDEAAINYGKAIDEKPGEKYFLEPQKRIQTAITHYRKLEEAKNAPPPPPPAPTPAPTPTPTPSPTPPPTVVASAPTPAKRPGSSRGTPSARPAAATTGPAHPSSAGSSSLTDTQVLAMVKSGIADESVELTVKNAKSVDFDLSSSGQRKLTAGGVSPDILKAMKARAAQQLASQP